MKPAGQPALARETNAHDGVKSMPRFREIRNRKTFAAITAVIRPCVTWLNISTQVSSRLLMITNPTATLQSCLNREV